MEAALGLRDLNEEIAALEDRDEILHIDLKGRDPDEGSTDIPYEKGALFLRHLEQTFGRARFDQFLKSYFNHFSFQSITTEQFVAYLKQNLLDKYPALAAKVPVDEWINKPGLPATAPKPTSPAFAQVERQAQRWLSHDVSATRIPTNKWTTQEWLHFLKFVQDSLAAPASAGGPADASATQLTETEKIKLMSELDRAFHFTRSGNSEIAFQWLLMSIRNAYEPAYPRLEEFLLSVGRRKFIKPLYEELAKTPDGKKRALTIYRRARSGYHPIAVATIDEVLTWP
jgi:aminopeptidase N